MSLLHNLSNPAIRSEVDIFSLPSTDTTCDYSLYSEYQPISNIQDSNSKLEFKITGNTTHYLDLYDSFLYLKIKILGSDGTSIAETAKISTSNNFFHSLFSQLDVYFNSNLISSSNNAYAYRAYIESLLSYGSDYNKSKATCSLFYLDSSNGGPCEQNVGYKKRATFIAESKSLELIDKLKFDLANQHRYILNDVTLTISLTKASEAFCLLSEVDTASYKIIYEEASFFVRKQILFPSIILAHQRLLDKGEVARYPHKKCEVKYLTIPQGNSNLIEENLFNNIVPNRVIIGFVKSSAFNGAIKENPFKFNHFNISNIGLSVNNLYFPSQPKTYNFEHNQGLLAYYFMFTSLGLAGNDVGLPFDRESFKESNALFIFDIIQGGINDSLISLDKTGNVKLDVKFSTALPCPTHCVIYAEFQAIIEIDKYRQINVS